MDNMVSRDGEFREGGGFFSLNCVNELNKQCSVFSISRQEFLSVGSGRRRFEKISISRFECLKNKVQSPSERQMPAPNVTISANLGTILLVVEKERFA